MFSCFRTWCISSQKLFSLARWDPKCPACYGRRRKIQSRIERNGDIMCGQLPTPSLAEQANVCAIYYLLEIKYPNSQNRAHLWYYITFVFFFQWWICFYHTFSYFSSFLTSFIKRRGRALCNSITRYVNFVLINSYFIHIDSQETFWSRNIVPCTLPFFGLEEGTPPTKFRFCFCFLRLFFRCDSLFIFGWINVYFIILCFFPLSASIVRRLDESWPNFNFSTFWLA